jgi:hypothetical protein
MYKIDPMYEHSLHNFPSYTNTKQNYKNRLHHVTHFFLSSFFVNMHFFTFYYTRSISLFTLSLSLEHFEYHLSIYISLMSFLYFLLLLFFNVFLKTKRSQYGVYAPSLSAHSNEACLKSMLSLHRNGSLELESRELNHPCFFSYIGDIYIRERDSMYNQVFINTKVLLMYLTGY